jgi:hypothetical protein
MPKYRLTQGLDYPPNRRAEAGEIVDDLPAKSISWLKEQGIIELIDGSNVKSKFVAQKEPALVEEEVAPVVADAIDSEDK